VIAFSAKLRSGQQFLGLGLSDEDIARLKVGEPVVLDLSSVGVGLWIKSEDGSRTFLQPRDSNVLVMAGDTAEDVGELLRVDLSKLKKT
jgi:hypothetical protein